MPYVLLDDSSLSDIANAIRSRNKLVRTYKPREMAPAIRALKDLIPQSDGYEVRIAEYEHQKIKVSRYLNEEKTYTESFSSTKPFWKIRAEIEADPGYTPGTLNYPDEMSVDRDIQISATPAEEITSQDITKNIYFKGWRERDFNYSALWQDEECTQYAQLQTPMIRPTGKVVYNFVDKNEDGCPYLLIGTFGRWGNTNQSCCADATDIIHNINTRGATTIDRLCYSKWLENIDISTFDVSLTENITDLFHDDMDYLRSIGIISYWDTRQLRQVRHILHSSRYINSLDLSGWDTPELVSATNIFPGGKILDISNWNTSKITSFSAGINGTEKDPCYLIMDKEEVKFSGDYIFNNISNCKYLVPPTVLDDYRQHPNWQSRASQIDDITKYTINRGNGQISITPNI